MGVRKRKESQMSYPFVKPTMTRREFLIFKLWDSNSSENFDMYMEGGAEWDELERVDNEYEKHLQSLTTEKLEEMYYEKYGD